MTTTLVAEAAFMSGACGAFRCPAAGEGAS